MNEGGGERRPADLSSLRIDRSAGSGGPGRGTRRILFLLLGIALVTAAAGIGWRYIGEVSGVPVVQVATARVVSAVRADSILTASGYLVSRTQAAIGAKVSGRVEKILVEEGDWVASGDVLAILEHADLDAGLLAAQAALARSRADVIEGEAILREDERDVARKKVLYENRVGPMEDWEKAEARGDASAARLDALRQQVRLSAARVGEAREQLENMFIRAPFDGTVISKDAEVGETITPGGMGAASGRGSVVTLADLAHLEVETDIKEDYIGRIRASQPARIEVDAVPDRSYKGRLRQIIPMGDRSRAIIQVKVEVLDADEALFPEMSASVHFLPVGSEEKQVPDRPQVFVPARAITRVDGSTVVWVVQDGTTATVPVITGNIRGEQTEIIEGLSGGEQVVLDPPVGLSEGGRVNLAVR